MKNLLYTVFFLALIIKNICVANESQISSSLASTEGILSSIVNGSVCTISGDYIDHEVDLIIRGPTPLVLQRTYRSSDFLSNHLYKSWQLSEPNQLEIFSWFEGSKKSDFFATLTTSQGVKARYHKFLKHTSTEEERFEFGNNKGFTNCGTGFISGKTNLKNNQLYIQAKKIKKGFISGSLLSGNGSKRLYNYHYSDSNAVAHCELVLDEATNNTRKLYFYGSDARISSIVQKNCAENLDFGSLHFTRQNPERMKKEKQLIVSSNIGQKIYYKFLKDSYEPEKGVKVTQYYLESVNTATKPLESYKYIKSAAVPAEHFSRAD